MKKEFAYRSFRGGVRACVLMGIAGSLASGAIAACGSDSGSPPADAGTDGLLWNPPPVLDAGDGGLRPMVSAGGKHACVILEGNSVRCWGSNEQGELGNPPVQDLVDGGYSFDKSPVASPTPASVGQAISLASGTGLYHNATCAISASGQVQCWGDDTNGALGRGDTSVSNANRPHPEALPVVALPPSEQVATNSSFSCAVSSGRVRCWGYNESVSMWTNTAGTYRSPVDITLPQQRTALKLAMGQYHVCSLLDDATVACWGANAAGQLGVPPTSSPNPQPTIIPSLSGVAEVGAGQGTTCVRTVGGQIECFGTNDNGLLGRELDQHALPGSSEPAAVHLPSGSIAIQLATGFMHACALLSDGSVWCWGANHLGELGSGQVQQGKMNPPASPTPVKVQGLPTTAAYVSAGNETTCAVLSDRSVMCWGDGLYGGLGKTPGDSSPQPVPTMINF